MALIDDVKAICDRLAPLGWRDLLTAVTGSKLDIQQSTPAALKAALTASIQNVDRTFPGFEDFDPAPACGIAAGKPSRSLLYHALASPGVVRDAAGKLLRGFPTLAEIETIENFVFGIQPPTLAEIRQSVGNVQLAVVVFATEYRPCADTADGAHADLTFSRTGIARVGTARPKYLPDVRGYWAEDEDNPHGFRVIPVRLTAWLAAATPGNKARVMRIAAADAKEKKRAFWIPVHKLFDGNECIAGLDLNLQGSARFFNIKLQRVMKSINKNVTGFPFVIEQGLGQLIEKSEHGRFAAVPIVQEALVRPAIVNGKALTFRVPKGKSGGFATYVTEMDQADDGAEIHPFPAYVHARTRVSGGTFEDLNERADVEEIVRKGGYDALLHIDFTGEGWVGITVPQLANAAGLESKSRPAYVLLSAPDFFPSCGQRELTRWSNSLEIPGSFRGDQLWGRPPGALSETRRPANLQLPKSPFLAADDTVTAVVGMGTPLALPSLVRMADALRASTLPDDGAGEFAPGWDVAVDTKAPGGTVHLAAYGLGSPFPEDAKLCAALSTFWPAVAPDVYRTMPIHTGNEELRGTVAPLTDEEIGQIGNIPWDGVIGPKVVQDGATTFVEMPSFLHVDYVTNAIENRFSNRLTARISAEEYERRVIAAARVHWVLSGGTNVVPTRRSWLLLSFRRVSGGDPELVNAENQGGHVLDGPVYRVEACFVGTGNQIKDSPKGPRFRRLPLSQHNFFFVSPSDPLALRRRDINPQWGRVQAE